jgi:hypothetical protein
MEPGCLLKRKKADLVFNHFNAILGDFEERAHGLNFSALGLPTLPSSSIDYCFSEDKFWAVIRDMPADKSSGLDDFIGLFYQTAWPVIKANIMNTFHAFWSLDFRSFYLVNQDYITLLRKNNAPVCVKDFRPISLIHSFSKLLTKVLSMRVSPFMSDLVQPNQSAFIKGRAIHDNFRVVQSSVKLLHVRKCSTVLLKFDIAKAFDTVSWSFLLKLLHYDWFSRRWIDWVSIILSSASTRILLNGNPGQRICHARGLRQGDPLSPLLFVMVMESLNALFRLADSMHILFALRPSSIRYRISLYADDLLAFIVPTEQDMRAVGEILHLFAATSVLHTNVGKCQFTRIQCSTDQIATVTRWFPCPLVHFPFKYLGVPLSVHPLKKAELQPLVDDVADRRPTWMSRLMSRAGRTTLVKVTLSAILVHISIAVKVSPWIFRAIDKLRRGFIWTGSDSAVGGKCMVAWTKVARPTELGGLGVLDLTTLGYALRLRWEWLQRTDPDHIWTPLPSKTDRVIQAMFHSSVTVQVGNGIQAKFWSDRWIDGNSLESSHPHLVAAVSKRVRK